MSKRWIPRAVCLWPGLARLWDQGSLGGLAAAVGFSLLLNAQLVATLVWTAWLPPVVYWAGWIAIAALWLVSAWKSHRAGAPSSSAIDAEDAVGAPTAQEDLFRQAQAQYLQGCWFEAEDRLRMLLKENSRDVESRLMLATLLRHTGRLDEAASELQQTARLEASAAWRQEIQTEWRQISAAEQLAETQNAADDESQDAEIKDAPSKDQTKPPETFKASKAA